MGWPINKLINLGTSIMDIYKTEQILINTSETHNKFWISKFDEKTSTVHTRWGRLGTKGQTQDYPFDSEHSAINFIFKKVNEKTRTGYKTATKTAFDKASIQSAIVGASNKCSAFQWVELVGKFITKIDDARLSEPDCVPAIYLEVVTKKAYDGKHDFRLLFTFDHAYTINSDDGFFKETNVISKSHPLYNFTKMIEEAIGRSLSA